MSKQGSQKIEFKILLNKKNSIQFEDLSKFLATATVFHTLFKLQIWIKTESNCCFIPDCLVSVYFVSFLVAFGERVFTS